MSTDLRRLFAFASLATLALVAIPAQAITFCVTSGSGGPTQFDQDMQYWLHASDQTVYVHLEQGTYDLITNSKESYFGDIYYDQTGTSDGTGQLGNASLHLVGGFVPGTNPPCSKRQVDPANTIISGQANGSNSSLRIAQQEGELLIDGLTFTKFGNGVQVSSITDATATLRNIAIVGNGNGDMGYAALGVGVSSSSVLGGGTGVTRIENCLIAGNNTHGLVFTDDTDKDVTQIIGCTIADNTGYGLSVGDPTNNYYILNGSLKTLNTIFRSNGIADVFAQSGGNKPTLDYTNVASIIGPANTTAHNKNTDPKFVGAGTDPAHPYDLQAISPLVNIGAPPTLALGGAYATTDIRGRTRMIGSHVDFGAYESLVDDTAAQVVTSFSEGTGTCPSASDCTLRTAITVANSNASPTTITFNLGGAINCPYFIQLASLLPDINSDITIDAYTQPGAVPNNTVPGYDGKICLVMRGGGLDHAFKTSGSGRLTVRGIEFEDFSTAAVRLSSGSGHVVTGNGFSSFPGETLANKDGVLIEGSASASQIGTYAFGDRNVFGQSTDAAIKLAGNGAGNHLIQGNYIGFNFDGTKPVGSSEPTPNKFGIYLQGSGANEISYNFVGASPLNAIHLTGAATSANRIIENSLGIAPADGSAAGNGYGTCNPLCLDGYAAIDIVSGAHDNSVGAIGGSGGNNFIINNSGPGVWIEQTAGTGNRVYGSNLIHDNGGYLPIDLGAQGPTLNDVGDGDFGGNNLQNYPTLSLALRTALNTVRVSGSLVAETGVAPQTYRVDVYWTDSCLFAGSGFDTPRGELKGYVGYFSMPGNGTTNTLFFPNTDLVASSRPPQVVGKSYFLSAVATDAAGNTSEPGPCLPYVDDYIFADGFGH
jgi:hypothetical protein